MQPQDVLIQLVGEGDGWDQIDTLDFMVYKPSKFPEADSAAVYFSTGIVELYSAEKIIRQFAIKATLEQVDH